MIKRLQIGGYNDRIILKFDRHLGSAAAEGREKLQSDWKSLNPNVWVSKFHDILWQSLRLVIRGPG